MCMEVLKIRSGTINQRYQFICSYTAKELMNKAVFTYSNIPYVTV